MDLSSKKFNFTVAHAWSPHDHSTSQACELPHSGGPWSPRAKCSFDSCSCGPGAEGVRPRDQAGRFPGRSSKGSLLGARQQAWFSGARSSGSTGLGPEKHRDSRSAWVHCPWADILASPLLFCCPWVQARRPRSWVGRPCLSCPSRSQDDSFIGEFSSPSLPFLEPGFSPSLWALSVN